MLILPFCHPSSLPPPRLFTIYFFCFLKKKKEREIIRLSFHRFTIDISFNQLEKMLNEFFCRREGRIDLEMTSKKKKSRREKFLKMEETIEFIFCKCQNRWRLTCRFSRGEVKNLIIFGRVNKKKKVTP